VLALLILAPRLYVHASRANPAQGAIVARHGIVKPVQLLAVADRSPSNNGSDRTRRGRASLFVSVHAFLLRPLRSGQAGRSTYEDHSRRYSPRWAKTRSAIPAPVALGCGADLAYYAICSSSC